MKINLPDTSARYLVGVSGGPDSVALLKAMTETGCRCVVGHCNFALRGEESDGDEAFVRQMCNELGVECLIVRFDTIGYAKEKGISIEMAARELRYDWFERQRVEHGCDYIAVAHNLNDQVETFFLNLARGTGLKGLCGMEWMNGRVVRPLLGVTREEIMAYVGGCCRIDRTNDDVRYKRNRIRHRVVPEMTEMNPSFLRTMEKNIENLRAAEALLDGNRGFDESRLEELYLELGGLGFGRERIYQIWRAEASGGSGQRFASDKAEVVINRGRAVVYEKMEDDGVEMRVTEDDGVVELKVDGEVAHVAKKKVRGELVLRRWKAGERFQPSGMGGKNKKISDFLTGLKMDVVEKERQLVVVDRVENPVGDGVGIDERIVWVVGKRVDERYLV